MKVYTVHEVLESTKKKLAEVTAERDALAAQVEVLKDSINKCTVDGVALLRLSSELKQAVAATPQQHLSQIRAEAGRAGFIEAYKIRGEIMHAAHSGEYEALNRFANQYAESVRQGGE